jgi:hypothetical protein
MSMPVAKASGLGYPGSDSLLRTEKGIETTSGFLGLLNYPVIVKVAYAALRQIDSDFRKHDNHYEIKINAVTCDQESCLLFTLNSNFFRRLQDYMGTQAREVTLEAGTFVYHPEKNSFCTYVKDESLAHVGLNERSFGDVGFLTDYKASNSEKKTIKQFSAELLVFGQAADETHQFACEFFAAELLMLSIDYANGWKLKIGQKSGILPAEECKQQLMQTISPLADRNYLCPITKKVMTDPIYNTKQPLIRYEWKAIKQWLADKKGKPPVHKNLVEEMLQRAYQLIQTMHHEIAEQEEQPGQPLSHNLLEQIDRLEYWTGPVIKNLDVSKQMDHEERAKLVLEKIAEKLLALKSAESTIVPSKYSLEPDSMMQQVCEIFARTHTVLA